MRCADFLQLYSDYRDGLIADPTVERRVRKHLRCCPRCLEYDALISRGVMAMRATSNIIPSRRFRQTLYTRLGAAPRPWSDLLPIRLGTAALIAALMVVAAIASLLWAGSARLQPTRAPVASTPTAPASAESLPPVSVIANPGVPFVSFTELPASPLGRGRLGPAQAERPVVRPVTLSR